jgi:CheY-like chemotaxis protein
MTSDFNAPEDLEINDLPGESPGGSDLDLSKVTALVIEDEEAISQVMCALLTKIGVGDVIAVRSAEDALVYIEDPDANIGIALVDLMLPGASGLALINTIRTHKRTRVKELPIVVVTSYTSMKVYKRAAEFDINGFLRKPVAPGALESAVIKALGGKVSIKAMQVYKEEAAALYGESGSKKKPGFFAMLFGTDIPPPKPKTQTTEKNSVQRLGKSLGENKSKAPKKAGPPGVKINRNA